jgi:hypothetical protein
MMRNDEIGDCTVAAAGHLIMGWNNDLGIAVNSEANMDTNGIIGKIEKEAKTLWSQPVFKYGVIIGGVLIAATILYNLLLTPKDK